MKKFSDYPISQPTLDALAKLGITAPTTVQEKSMLPLFEGRDLIVKAPTGTGKTFAFGIPVLERLKPDKENVQAVILAPTRELAVQIADDLSDLAIMRDDIRIATLYGGENIRRQFRQLDQKPQIVVGTPGRVIDHLKRKSLFIGDADFAILDEADRMLDMGFVDDVRYILNQMRHVGQMAMYSATLSREVMDISWLYQYQPVEISVDAVDEDRPDITQYYIEANGEERIEAIADLMKEHDVDRALVFVNTKQSAEICHRKLRAEGFTCAAIHGDIPQKGRNAALRDFRDGKVSILAATDVAARGLDIEGVDMVFNYDLPLENENYIHRIGRTGRAGRKGIAVTFVSPSGKARFRSLKHQLHLPVIPYPWESTEARDISDRQTVKNPQAAKLAKSRGKRRRKSRSQGKQNRDDRDRDRQKDRRRDGKPARKSKGASERKRARNKKPVKINENDKPQEVTHFEF